MLEPIQGTDNLIRRAAGSSVASLFLMQARIYPDRLALVEGDRTLTYGQFGQRVAALAGWLERRGVKPGDRIAILSENRLEYLELFLAAAWIGAIFACQNWRLAAPELAHCIALVEPQAILVSPRHADRLSELPVQIPIVLTFGPDYESVVTSNNGTGSPHALDPECPLLVLYTSGTTGLPKGAVISHRAEIARNMVLRAEFGIAAEDAFVAWSPLYHMGAAEFSLGTLMCGGTVFVVDGFNVARLCEIVGTEQLGWLLLMPGMVGRFSEELKRTSTRAKGVRVCGVMADLVPPAEIAEVTTLLGAPYANTFGATETGCPPCSSNLISIGAIPTRLSKQQSPFCEVRLVDAEDRDVPDGTPGELCMRGPTLFSGYWRAPETNAQDFRGGWFHMGDVFVRTPDGTLDFVDRVKYLIKSGGENIYPAEIERVLLQDARVADAAVVRKRDPKWGEVPVAIVARRDDALTKDELRARCREQLAGYKQPKEIYFIPFDAFPRSASGKIQRHELERRFAGQEIEGEGAS
ncbi:class I adenylate-forming enzyme family protein [Dongia deserti]|uniref:class I adenylate-forming enzyme family protein n=1 Tax=Dongia deserti TaxID=2268030 RepID=UPI000E6534A5|nr:AMP-binding protein [Dongia deserti]